GQPLLLLHRAAVPQQRPHDVHLRMAGGAVAAALVHFLEDRRRGADAEAAAAMLLGDEAAEESALGQCLDEVPRISPLAVERAPVLAGKARAERGHRLADLSDVGAG